MSPGNITFGSDSLTSLTVNTPQGGRPIHVQGTPNQGAVGSVVTSLIGHGADNVYVGDGSLSRVQGELNVTNVSKHSSLSVNGSNDTAKQNVTVALGRIHGLAPADITYGVKDVTGIDLDGGTGGNTFHVLRTCAGSPVVIDGGSGANTLIGPDITHTWRITGNDAGNVGRIAFSRVGSLTGGKRADTFLLSDGANLSGRIDGGIGDNTLDFSAQSRSVAADLRSGVATGIAGGVTRIVNLTGGQGTNILVGDDNANTLQGGSGRNLLIGGGGIDHVVGGSGDNILIGGSISADLSLTVLDAVMAEFARTDEAFVTRFTHILSGDGTNDPSLLDPDSVTDDGVANVVTGGPGANWFFVPDALATIARKPNDIITITK